MQIPLECILLFPKYLFTCSFYSFQGKSCVFFFFFNLQHLALRQTNSGDSINVCGMNEEKKLEGKKEMGKEDEKSQINISLE